jgi:hypothetical protein
VSVRKLSVVKPKSVDPQRDADVAELGKERGLIEMLTEEVERQQKNLDNAIERARILAERIGRQHRTPGIR